MASINYAAREISVKIVYYGPGLSGKTTNLQVIHRKVPPEYKSDMVSLATETDRTLFFDFLPLDLGKIKGFSTKFQLYTVPGQVYYNATRKLVLRGVDGVVFVADSGSDKMAENHESFQNLEENLAEYGYKRESIPIILQYNKRDLPNALPVEEIQQQFNKYDLPWSEAVANKGVGVFDSLKLIGKIVIDYLNKKYSRPARPGVSEQPATPQSFPTQRPIPQQQQVPPPRQQQYQGFQQNTSVFPPVSGSAQSSFPQQSYQPPQQQYPGFQQPMNIQTPPPPPPRQQMPQRTVQYPASTPQQIMPTPSQLHARQFPQQQQPAAGGTEFQKQPGLANLSQPIQQGGNRPHQFGSSPVYQQPINPPQSRVPNQDTQSQRSSGSQDNTQYPQGIQNQQQSQNSDPFSNEYIFEPENSNQSQQQKPNFTNPNNDYFNYGNVSLNTQPAPQYEQQQPEENFELQNTVQRHASSPLVDQSGKTDLDLEIEKYQREIEEKQRRMRVQGQAPVPPPPTQQQPPQRMPQGQASMQRTQPQQESEKDYDAFNIELSGYQGSNQPATQRQPIVPQSDNDDNMYFTSIDTDRQKKPIKKPVNPRTQQQRGFLSKFFNSNNRDIPE